MAGNLAEEVDKQVKDLHKYLTEAKDELKGAIAKQEREAAEIGKASAETNQLVLKWEGRFDEISKNLEGQYGELKAKYEEVKQFADEIDAKTEKFIGGGAHAAYKTALSILENSEELKHWDKEGLKSEQNSPRIALGNLLHLKRSPVLDREGKAITGGDALRQVMAGTYLPEIFGVQMTEMPQQHLRNRMRVVNAKGSHVNYVQRTGYVNRANIVAEGATKPTSDMTFVNKKAEATVIAHTTVISRQQARHTPTIVNYLEDEMINGLLHVESDKILWNDGEEGFTGILMHEEVQQYNRHNAGNPEQPDNKLDALRRSDTQLRKIYLIGDTFVVNEEDWEEMELTKDNEARYLWVTVQLGGQEYIWRKPIFVTPAMPAGQFANGAFRYGAILYDFEQAFMQLFPQHAELAIKNQVLMLVEEEITVATVVPEAFVKGYYIAGQGSGS